MNRIVYSSAVSFIFLLTPLWLPAQPDSLSVRYTGEEKKITHLLGKTSLSLSITQYGSRRDLVFINLHDDEFTSVDAARLILQQQGGVLIKIHNKGERRITFHHGGRKYMFDPNRIFSRTGILQTLKRHSRISRSATEQIRKLSQRLLALIPREARYVIALHNNTDGEPLSILNYQAGNSLSVNAREVCHTPSQDPDDFFLTTSGQVHQHFCEAGYNSVWQHHQKAEEDGSLSIYYRNHKRIVYINCETEHGKTGQYFNMLQILLEVIPSPAMSVKIH